MKLNKNKESQGFYRDIDKHSRRKSCCTCQGILLIFVLLFIIGTVGVWWLLRAISDTNLQPIRQIIPSAQDLKNYEQKIIQVTTQAVLKKETGSSESVSLVITETELTSVLAAREDELTNNQISIKDVSAAITPEFIEIYGRLTKPLRTKVKVQFLPGVEKGHLTIVVKSLEAGKIKLPKLLVGELNKLIENAITDMVARGSITYITGIDLSDKELTVSGRMQ